MARRQSIKGDIEAIGGELAGIREAMERTAAVLFGATGEAGMADENIISIIEEGLGEIRNRQQGADAHLVRAVERLCRSIEASVDAFERRDLPTRYERYLSIFSRGAAKRARNVRLAAFSRQEVEECVAGFDALLGLLSEHRGFLLDRRSKAETELARLLQGREGALEVLLRPEEAGRSRPEAVAALERFVGLFQDLVDAVNSSIGGVNTLINKVTIETERLLVLRHAMAPAIGAPLGAEGTSAERPHIAGIQILLEMGMLSMSEIERRRRPIDESFESRFQTYLDKREQGHYVKA